MLTRSKATEILILSTALLGAIGCYGGPSIDPQLQAQRRELAKQTVSTESAELPAREGDDAEDDEAIAMAMPMGGAGAPPDLEQDNQDEEERTDDPEAPAPSDDDDPEAEPAPPPPSEEGTASSDSVRCGDGVVDSGELCDIAIGEDEPGSCPMDCDDSDPCKPQRYVVLGCRTRCVPVEPPADCAE